MPEEFQTPPLGSQLERIMKDALSEYGDTISPLTPQHSEIELTRITVDPKLDLREESPLAQAQKIKCLKAALTRKTNDKLTNRAKSSEIKIPIKCESEEVGSSTRCLAPDGQRQGRGDGEECPIRIHNRERVSGGNNPPGRGPLGDDPNDNGDSDDEDPDDKIKIKDEDELNAQPNVRPNVQPHAQPNIPLIHGGNIDGNVAGQPVGNVLQRNYLRGYTPGNTRYRNHMQLKYVCCIDNQVSQLLKYYHTFKVTGPNQDEDQVLYTGLFLEGIASE
ncbi:hypothetical protein OG21DRAFT_1523143 [Imleria badia]|nr:hypothetical protein OG21DRAFT_1523143 [Imleria badia]